MRDRNKQRMLWSDKDFVKELERIQAKRLLNGNKVNNLGQLTGEIIKCPSYDQLKKELESFQRNILGIKLDKKRGLKQ